MNLTVSCLMKSAKASLLVAEKLTSGHLRLKKKSKLAMNTRWPSLFTILSLNKLSLVTMEESYLSGTLKQEESSRSLPTVKVIRLLLAVSIPLKEG